MAETKEFRLVPVRRGSLISRVREAVRSYTTGPFTSSSHDWSGWAGLQQTATGLHVDEFSALNQSMVWKCVTRISGDAASLPLMLYKRLPDAGKVKFTTHPLYRILHDAPNPEQTSMVWRQVMMSHLLIWGNSYSEIVRDQAGRTVELWPIPPDRIQPFRRTANSPLQYKFVTPAGQNTFFDASDILHFKGLSFNGTVGYSVIDKARESLGLNLATERFGSTFFGNGATFGGILEHPGKLTDLGRKNLQESLNARHQGVDRAHRFVILEESMKFSKQGIPPNEAQFLETRRFQLEEIEHWFNIPKAQTRVAIEDESIEYYTTTIKPWLETIEQELTLKLISPSEYNIQVIEHSLEGRLRANQAGRSEYYSKLFGIGAMTANEIRELENMPPIEGGDTAYVPLNLTPANKAEEFIQAQIDAKNRDGAIAKTPAELGPTPLDAAMNRIDQLLVELADARRVSQEREDQIDLARTEGANMLVLARADWQMNEALTAAIHREELAKKDVEIVRLAQQSEGQSLDVIAANQDQKRAEDARDEAVKQAKDVTEAHGKTIAGMALLSAERDVARQTIKDMAAQAIEAAEKSTTYRASVQAALRGVLVETWQGALQGAADRARKAQRSPDYLVKWMDTFYPVHVEWTRARLRPVLRAWCAATDYTDPVESLIDRIVTAYRTESESQLRMVAAETDVETLPPALERILRRWESGRAESLVEELTNG